MKHINLSILPLLALMTFCLPSYSQSVTLEEELQKLLENTAFGNEIRIATDDEEILVRTDINGNFEHYGGYPSSKETIFERNIYKDDAYHVFFERHETLVRAKAEYQAFHPLFAQLNNEFLEVSDTLKKGKDFVVNLVNVQDDDFTYTCIYEINDNYVESIKITDDLYDEELSRMSISRINSNVSEIRNYEFNDYEGYGNLRIIEYQGNCPSCVFSTSEQETRGTIVKQPKTTNYKYRNGTYVTDYCGRYEIQITDKSITLQILNECPNKTEVKGLSLGSGFTHNLLEIFDYTGSQYVKKNGINSRGWFVNMTPESSKYPNEKYKHYSYGITCKVWRSDMTIGDFELIQIDRDTFSLGASDVLFKRVN